MTKLGYARVSTSSQDLGPQLDALSAAGCERVFREVASGAKADRPEFRALMEYARSGDTIVVWKLDRMARSLANLIEIVTELAERDVHLSSISEPWLDTSTPAGRMIFQIFGAMAEFERNLIRERTMAALATARLKGRVGGRPRALTEPNRTKAEQWLAEGKMTKQEIARALGVGLSTLKRELKRNGEKQ